MRIIFMGTPDFAAETLRALVGAGYEVVLAVTQPDRPKGRHGAPVKSDVRVLAESCGIPVITPERIRTDAEAKDRMRALAPDVIVVTAFGQILPEDVLSIPRFGCINVHASLLPKYRGAAPVQWAVLNGDAESGVTTMMMDAGLDTGDILEQCTVALDPRETGGSLFLKLQKAGGELIVHTLRRLEEGTLTRTPQDPALATKVGQFRKTSGRIDWCKDAAVIERMIRGLDPWPSAFSSLNGKTVKLWDADVIYDDDPAQLKKASELKLRPAGHLGDPADMVLPDGTHPGDLFTDGRQLLVRCGTGTLRINELQMEGRKRMHAEDFLKGYRFD